MKVTNRFRLDDYYQYMTLLHVCVAHRDMLNIQAGQSDLNLCIVVPICGVFTYYKTINNCWVFFCNFLKSFLS